MLTAKESISFDGASLFDSLATTGSGQTATAGPDQATRVLQHARLQYKQALESEGKSLNSIATISDNESPTPTATKTLQEFIVTVIKLVGRSFHDSLKAKPEMEAMLADRLSSDPCGEQAFPVCDTWWEVDPGFKPKPGKTKIRIPSKKRERAFGKKYTGKPTSLQVLCKRMQQECYNMVRAVLPLLATPATRRRVNAAIRNLEDAKGIVNDPQRLEIREKRPSLVELQKIILEQTLDVHDGQFYISELLQMSRQKRETLADYARRISDLRDKCNQAEKAATGAGKASFYLPDSFFVGRLILFMVRPNTKATRSDQRDEETPIRKALGMSPGERLSDVSWKTMCHTVKHLPAHLLHAYDPSWCKKGYTKILYSYDNKIKHDPVRAGPNRAGQSNPNNRGAGKPKTKRARKTPPCPLCLRDLGRKIWHSGPCDDALRLRAVARNKASQKGSARPTRSGDGASHSPNHVPGVGAKGCPPDKISQLCPYCQHEPGYTWKRAIHRWPPEQCLKRPDGPRSESKSPQGRSQEIERSLKSSPRGEAGYNKENSGRRRRR